MKPTGKDHPLYIVGDRIGSLPLPGRTMSISRCEELLSQGIPLESQQVILGQGVSETRYKSLYARLRDVDAACTISPSAAPIKASKAATHKHHSRNIAIGEPRRIDTNTFEALMLLDDLNDEMADHLTGIHVAGVDDLRDLIETTVRHSVRDMLAGRKAPDLFASVLDEIPSLVICRILGVPLADRNEFRRWGRVIQLAPRDDVPGIEASVDKTYGYLLDLIRGKRPTEPDGFIRRHADSRGSGPDELTDEDIAGVLLGILVGGDNNALSVMTKIVYALLVAPTLWDRLVASPAIIPQAVEEMIRLIPIGLLSVFPRVATGDIALSIGTIPSGSIVYPDAFLANRDPDVYDDPLAVKFDRTGLSHLQFGHGVHFCMGPHLARLEIATVLRVLVEEVPSLAFDADPAKLRWQVGTVLRRPDELPVRWSLS